MTLVTYVIVEDAAVRWGLPAPAVRRVVEPGEWRGPPPVEVAAVLAAAPARAGRRRLLVLAADGRELALATAGPIRSRPVPVDRICPLPGLVAARVSPAIVGVLFEDDGLPVLVLDAWRLQPGGSGERRSRCA